MRGLIVASILLLGSIAYFVISEVNNDKKMTGSKNIKSLVIRDQVGSATPDEKISSDDLASVKATVKTEFIEPDESLVDFELDKDEECCEEELAVIEQYMSLHENPESDIARVSYKEHFLQKHGDTAEAHEYLLLRGRFMNEEPVPIEDFIRWSELVNHFFPSAQNLQEHDEILKFVAKYKVKGTSTYDMSVLETTEEHHLPE